MITPYEFYTTPDGDVKKVRDDETSLLAETDREFIEEFIRRLQEFYPEAYEALCSEYAKSKLNKSYHDFLLVRRFVKCNFGEFDKKLDITETGSFQFEFVKCPLRGECKYEDCICAPKFNSTLRPRELDVMRLVYARQSVEEIASSLYISIDTVKNHRKNALQRLKLKSTTDFIAYAYQNSLFISP